jgi:hypothetical protein
MRIDVFVSLALLACGGARLSSTVVTSCDAVAQHLLELAERDNRDAASPSLAAGIRGEVSRQCRETPWSDSRKRCLLEAGTQDRSLACPAQ